MKQCELLWHIDLDAKPANHTLVFVARQSAHEDFMAWHVAGVLQDINAITN